MVSWFRVGALGKMNPFSACIASNWTQNPATERLIFQGFKIFQGIQLVYRSDRIWNKGHDGFTGEMMRNIANKKKDEFVSKSRENLPISHCSCGKWCSKCLNHWLVFGGSQISHAPFLTKLELNWFQGFTHVSWVWPQEECATRINSLCLMLKTWCRASEGAPAVVTFQTFYRGDHKTLKNETLASGAISSSSSPASSSSSFTYP